MSETLSRPTRHIDMTHYDTSAQREKLAELISKFRTAMLTTLDAAGHMSSRPMTPLGDGFDGAFWFATEIDNAAVQAIQSQASVNVSFMHEGDNHYVSASGRGHIVTDRAEIERLWSPALSVFFKGGKDDPRVCLIRVDVTEADYWDGPGNLLTKLAFFATVAATGNHEALSDSGNVKL